MVMLPVDVHENIAQPGLYGATQAQSAVSHLRLLRRGIEGMDILVLLLQ